MNTRMTPRLIKSAITAALAGAFAVVAQASESWPQFRGPNGSGVGSKASPPGTIGPTNHVLWKIEVPWSPSSPCIWEQRIFLTTFVDQQLQTRCYGRRVGKL